MKHATPLTERQEAMKKRLAVAKAQTKALQQNATCAVREARKARRLRDQWLIQLSELRDQRRRLRHLIEHAQRDSRRALRKAQRHADASAIEVARIDRDRQFYREVLGA
jgi:hypothetical protein